MMATRENIEHTGLLATLVIIGLALVISVITISYHSVLAVVGSGTKPLEVRRLQEGIHR